MNYEQFKAQWLQSQGKPATGYDGCQESVIKSAYIDALENEIERLTVFKRNAVFVLHKMNEKGRSTKENARIAMTLLVLDKSGELYEELK